MTVEDIYRCHNGSVEYAGLQKQTSIAESKQSD